MSVDHPVTPISTSDDAVANEESGAVIHVDTLDVGKQVVKRSETRGRSVQHKRRIEGRKCNVFLSTRHLSRFDQLFWRTDTRNASDYADFAVGTTTRKRKRQVNPPILTVGRLTLERAHESPNIYIIDHFLSEAELAHCDSIIQKSKFQKSFVDAAEVETTTTITTTTKKTTRTRIDSDQRTSTFVSLAKRADRTVASIERKSADLLGLSTDHIEPLQLVRYRTNQFFDVHHDLGNLRPDGTVELPPKQAFCKRRLATIFCYLNTVQEGGCTYFPALGHPMASELRVAPVRGRAVLFCNVLKDGDADPRTVHAGEPVKGGKGTVKYGLNIWACEE